MAETTIKLSSYLNELKKSYIDTNSAQLACLEDYSKEPLCSAFHNTEDLYDNFLFLYEEFVNYALSNLLEKQIHSSLLYYYLIFKNYNTTVFDFDEILNRINYLISLTKNEEFNELTNIDFKILSSNGENITFQYLTSKDDEASETSEEDEIQKE